MGHFFDPEQGGPLRLELRSVDGRDFTLLRRIGYQSDDYDTAFVVPTDTRCFATDLASVPTLFTWLVPRVGKFLPAAVLHDGLIRPGEYIGPPIDRAEADLVFREAMIGLGTGRVRAWLMWSAVTLACLWARGTWRSRAAVVLLLGTVTVLGALATLDLLDVVDVLPWMGQRPLLQELAFGAGAAVLVPTALSVLWGRVWRAGVIIGVALALLLHVTAVLLGLYSAYLLLERLVSGPQAPRGRWGRRGAGEDDSPLT